MEANVVNIMLMVIPIARVILSIQSDRTGYGMSNDPEQPENGSDNGIVVNLNTAYLDY